MTNIKTTCPNYILKFRNTRSQVYVGAWVKLKIVTNNHELQNEVMHHNPQ